jgi:hypothetical protein
MTRKRRQLEKMLAETKDNVVRMQLTRLLSDELQRQNGIIRKVAEAVDSLLRDMLGLLGKRNPKNAGHERIKNGKAPQKQLTSNLPKKGKDRAPKQPDDLDEIIALWPKLPEHVKAAISDIVKIS